MWSNSNAEARAPVGHLRVAASTVTYGIDFSSDLPAAELLCSCYRDLSPESNYTGKIATEPERLEGDVRQHCLP